MRRASPLLAIVGTLAVATPSCSAPSDTTAGATPTSKAEPINGYPSPDGKRQHIGIPAYWSPATTSGTELFDRVGAAAPVAEVLIINGPASGPPVPFDPKTKAAIDRLRARGIRVLGYVDTGYLGRTGLRTGNGSTSIATWQAQIDRDAKAWHDLYAADGIFLDQTLSECGKNDEFLDAYARVVDRMRERDQDAFVAMNPGTNAAECYTTLANSIVIFENTFAEYRKWTPPKWVRDHPATSFWHLVHDTPPTEMAEAIALSRQRNAGYVYVTDDRTEPLWDGLPGYWDDQVKTLAGD